MLRYLLLVLALLVSGCTPMRHFNAPVDHLSDAQQLTDMTVALTAVDDEDGTTRAYCSGVWVTPTKILTAAHCVIEDLTVGDSLSFSVKSDVKSEEHAVARSATLVAVDQSHDLALLQTKDFGVHPIAHVAFGVSQGQFVQAMGQTLGLWWSYSNGTVGAIRHWPKPSGPFDFFAVADAPDMLWVQTTTPVSGGNSGGGLFDEYGDLVGLCHGSFTHGQNVNLFVHRDHIAAFLRAQKVVQ